MPQRQPAYVLVALLSLAVLLGACGGGGGGGPLPEPPANSYRPSAFQNGSYTAADFEVLHFLWDDPGVDWDWEEFDFDQVVLTFVDNGVSGTARVERLQDRGGTRYSTDGDMLQGWTVGETVAIRGFIDGSVIGFQVRSPSGASMDCLWAVYDGDIDSWTPDLEFSAVGYMSGVCSTSALGARAGSGTYITDLVRVGDAASTPTPTSISLGRGDSIYMDGNWIGDMRVYVPYFDTARDDFSYSRVRYELDLTLAGNALTGIATITELGSFADFDGYPMGTTFAVEGTIAGSRLYLVLSDGDWRYRVVSAPSSLSDPEPPGTVTSHSAGYTVAFDSRDHWGGEVGLELERNP